MGKKRLPGRPRDTANPHVKADPNAGTLWEQSLLAMAEVHSTSMQADLPLSRASFAPTGGLPQGDLLWLQEWVYSPTTSSACKPFCPSTTARSEERPGGEECASTCRSRWWTVHK